MLYDEVYRHLVCVFSYWDVVLTGLLKIEGKYFVCKRVGLHQYATCPVELDDKCLEFLEDYRKAYHHQFYEYGKRIAQYDGRPLDQFSRKWKGSNPIMEKVDGLLQIPSK